tara:strand:+ start:1449 stop:1652 length:204 start_codon:yes stop_codon:yes gene_type:complete
MINKTFSQLIITFAFFYSAIVCFFKAKILLEEQEYVLSSFLFLCSLSAFLGALRFQIQKFVNFLKKK